MEDDKNLMLDHEYDGIQELDNNLPNWWLWTFFGAIIFAFLYWIHYDVSQSGPTLDQELAQGIARVEQHRKNAQSSGGGEEVSEEEMLAAGQTVFRNYCAACHGQKGEGGVGPNLTDGYWIYEKGAPDTIKGLVTKGILDKGMPAWESMLKPNEIDAVVKYVSSIRNTNEKGKEPQGNKVDE
ncbi:MAG: c-type cytochrome [Bdellovibrionales bacterium]|nr:c-type cytochrome [Bdellovibrionales bacterium]